MILGVYEANFYKQKDPGRTWNRRDYLLPWGYRLPGGQDLADLAPAQLCACATVRACLARVLGSTLVSPTCGRGRAGHGWSVEPVKLATSKHVPKCQKPIAVPTCSMLNFKWMCMAEMRIMNYDHQRHVACGSGRQSGFGDAVCLQLGSLRTMPSVAHIWKERKQRQWLFQLSYLLST